MAKMLVALLAVLNVYSYECMTLEAQVFAKVIKSSTTKDLCTYKVQIEQIQIHPLCPLTAEEIEESEVVSKNYGVCYAEGSVFGHILVKDLNAGSIFID